MRIRRWTLQAVPLDFGDPVSVAWAQAWNAICFTDPAMRWVFRHNAVIWAAGGIEHDRKMGVRTEPIRVSSIGWPR